MKKFSKILLASALVVAMCVVGIFSVAAADVELIVGANTVPANDVYTFVAPEDGHYVITVDGTGDYSVGPMNMSDYDLTAGMDVKITIGEAEADVVINIEKTGEIPGIDATPAELDTPVTVSVGAWDPAYIMVIPEEAGRYTATSSTEGVIIGIVSASGDIDYEVNFVDVETKAHGPVYFVVASENFEDMEAEVTVTLEASPVPDGTILNVGVNKDVAISGWGTTVTVFPTGTGCYTVTSSNENVMVGVMDADGNINYEINYINASMADRAINFVLATVDNEDVVADVTVAFEAASENPAPANVLEVGKPQTVNIPAEGVEITVIATKAGRYTIAGEGIKVGVVVDTENGPVTDWTVSTLDAAKEGDKLVFVVATEDGSAAAVELTVVVTDIDNGPAAQPSDKDKLPGSEAKPGDVDMTVAVVLAVVSTLGVAVVIGKKKIFG